MLGPLPTATSADIDGLIDPAGLETGGARLYDYWREKRGPRKMPCRADLEPGDLRDLLPDIALVDVLTAPPHFRYRLAGTRHVAARGGDPTGTAVADSYLGRDVPGMRERVLGNYRAVVETGRPQFRDLRVVGHDNRGTILMGGRLVARFSLFLPLAADGETVDMILTYTRFATL